MRSSYKMKWEVEWGIINHYYSTIVIILIPTHDSNALGISTVRKTEESYGRATNLLGSEVQSVLEVISFSPFLFRKTSVDDLKLIRAMKWSKLMVQIDLPNQDLITWRNFKIYHNAIQMKSKSKWECGPKNWWLKIRNVTMVQINMTLTSKY